MFNPKCRILICRNSFPQDQVVCLGTQLISIVSSLSNLLSQHIWYGADVEAFGIGVRKYNLDKPELNKIGSYSEFIKFCSEIDQFIWGDFLCIDSNFSSQNIQGIELETEDQSYRSIECEGVLLEIRAFDTSFFEIYSEDLEIMKHLSKVYKIEIEENEL